MTEAKIESGIFAITGVSGSAVNFPRAAIAKMSSAVATALRGDPTATGVTFQSAGEAELKLCSEYVSHYVDGEELLSSNNIEGKLASWDSSFIEKCKKTLGDPLLIGMSKTVDVLAMNGLAKKIAFSIAQYMFETAGGKEIPALTAAFEKVYLRDKSAAEAKTATETKSSASGSAGAAGSASSPGLGLETKKA